MGISDLMPNVKYTLDANSFREFFKDMPDKLKTAERDALNRTMSHGKTVAKNDLANELGAGKASVAKRLNVVKATKAKLESVLIIRGGHGINLAGLHARQTNRGVTARLYGLRAAFPHAFLTTGLSNNKIVGLREGSKREMTKGKYAGRKIMKGPRAGQPLLRQPIAAQYGPTVAETWEKTPGIAVHTNKEIEFGLPKNLATQVNRFLKS